MKKKRRIQLPKSLPFAWKIGLVLSAMSLLITGSCLYGYYTVVKTSVIRQIGKDLGSVGRLGALMFDEQDRNIIRELTRATDADAIVTRQDTRAMETGTTMLSLSQSKIDEYQSSSDFQRLLDVTQRILTLLLSDIEPSHKYSATKEEALRSPIKLLQQGGVGIYLTVPTRLFEKFEGMKYLVSAAPYPCDDGWPGNPIGNLSKLTGRPSVFAGEAYIPDDFYTDEYYSSISVLVPLLNSDGSLLAILGLDYAASREDNSLFRIQKISLILTGCSLLLVFLAAAYLAQEFLPPLRLLQHVARQVSMNNYDVTVDVTTGSTEIASVANAFNRMTARLRSVIDLLRYKQGNLSDAIHFLDKRISPALGEIMQATSDERDGSPALPPRVESSITSQKLQTIREQAQTSLAEVRLMMDIMGYEYILSPMLAEELLMAAHDVQDSTGHTVAFQCHAEHDAGLFRLKEFLLLRDLCKAIFRLTWSNLPIDCSSEFAIQILKNNEIRFTGTDNEQFTRLTGAVQAQLTESRQLADIQECGWTVEFLHGQIILQQTDNAGQRPLFIANENGSPGTGQSP